MSEMLERFQELAAEAYPEDEWTSKAVVIAFREAFVKGAMAALDCLKQG